MTTVANVPHVTASTPSTGGDWEKTLISHEKRSNTFQNQDRHLRTSPKISSVYPNPTRERGIELLCKSLTNVSSWNVDARKHPDVIPGLFHSGSTDQLLLANLNGNTAQLANRPDFLGSDYRSESRF